MATTVSAFSTLNSINIRANPHHNLHSRHSFALPITNVCFQPKTGAAAATYLTHLTLKNNNNSNDYYRNSREILKPRSVEEETVVPEESNTVEEAEAETTPPTELQQQGTAVSVPVSPSDTLTMFFQADGTMSETDIPKVTKALEGTEGIAGVKVQVLEGIASVELAKQTTIQATGVASTLIETIQGAGFKLQTLNLSFEDEEDVLV